MPPLPDQHRVAVVESRDDKRGVRVGDHCVERVGAVRKADRVIAELEVAGRAPNCRPGDFKRPAGLRVLERSYWRTMDATAAAAAATWRGSGP